MKIPKKFKLFGQIINVEYSDTLFQDEDKVGIALFRENKIMLQKSNKGVPMLKEHIDQTFLHELMHFLFYYSNNLDLTQNEEAVNILSLLFHQFITSSEGELK